MSVMKITGCLILIILFAGTSIVEAGDWANQSGIELTDLSIEELLNVEVDTVYGASKFEQKVTEAPSSVSIVTADDIKKYGYRTIADILRSLRGFFVSYDRNYSYVGMRGFGRPGDYNSRFLLLIDGHRTNDAVYDSASVGTEALIDVDLIDRVEVIRGPGSSIVYGSNAVFAVINIITRRGRDARTLEASAEAGSSNTYKGRLTYGNSFQNGMEAIVSGSWYDSKGSRLFFKEFDSPDTNHGITEHTDYDRNYSAFAKLSYHDFTLEGAYVSRTKGIPTASFDTDFNDPRNKTVDWMGYLDLNYEHSLSSSLSVAARLFYESYGYSGDYMYSGVINKDLARGDWLRGELKALAKLSDRHNIILGAEYQANIRQFQKNYDEKPYALYFDDKRHSSIFALYIQDEFTLHKKFLIDAGVRYDLYSTFGSTTNPRLALIYNPSEKTYVKLLYGTSFRAPNMYELYYQTGAGSTKGNPDLKSEKISTYELVYEQYLGAHLRATATGYYYKITNLISQITDPIDNALTYRNIGKVNAKGIELELEAKLPSGYEGRISYSYQKAEDAETGETLSNSARHLAKFNMIVPLVKKKLFLGIEEQYMSERKTLSGNDLKSLYLTNLTLFSRNLLKNLEASFSVYNLFDCRYKDPGAEEHLQNEEHPLDAIQQDGRTFRLKLTYRF